MKASNLLGALALALVLGGAGSSPTLAGPFGSDDSGTMGSGAGFVSPSTGHGRVPVIVSRTADAFRSNNFFFRGGGHPFPHPFPHRGGSPCCWAGWSDYGSADSMDVMGYVTAPYAAAAPEANPVPPQPDFQPHVITIPQGGDRTSGSTDGSGPAEGGSPDQTINTQ